MEMTELGRTGLRVSRLALGTMQFGWTADEKASFAVLDAYVAAGGNLLDSADIYSYWVRGHRGGESESIIGRWLKASGRRDEVLIATKVRGRMWPGPGGEGLGREHLIKGCEASLKRLGVETIDLYQVHWPDETTPIDETLQAMDELVRAGKVRYIGASNHDAAALRRALDSAEAAGLPAYTSLQPHYNLVHRGEFEGELEALCLERGLAVLPYSPLAKGFLTGKYVRGAKVAGSARANGVKEYATDDAWAALAQVRAEAARLGTTATAVALAWLLQRPAITAPIVGANTPEQLADAVAAVGLRVGVWD